MVLGQALRTLIMARLLGPQTFGVLNLANATANLTSLADFGTSIIGNQKASEARGRNDDADYDRNQIDACGARMWPSLVLGLLIGAAALALWLGGREQMALAAGFVAVSSPMQGAWFAIRGYLRVAGQFTLAAKAQVAQVALWLTVVPIATWLWGLPGAFVTIALSYIAPIAAVAHRVPLTALLVPRWRPFRRWFIAGMPLWLGLIGGFAFTNVEQFLIGAHMGTAAVGVFAIGLLVNSALVAFSDGAAAAAHPQTLEDSARRGSLSVEAPSIWRTMRACQGAMGVLVPLSWLGLLVLTTLILPEYESSLVVVLLLGPAAAALGIATATNASLLAVGKQHFIPIIFLAAATAKGLLGLLLAEFWPSVMAFVVASYAGSLFLMVWYLSSVARALQSSRPVHWVIVHMVSPLLLGILGVSVYLCFEAWGTVGYGVGALGATVIAVVIQALLWRNYTAWVLPASTA